MKRPTVFLLGAIVLTVVTFVALRVTGIWELLVVSSVMGHCDRRIVEAAANPSGRRFAMVVDLDCGATTELARYVTVSRRRTGSPPRDAVLSFLDQKHAFDSVRSDDPRLTNLSSLTTPTLRWISDDTLEIRVHALARVSGPTDLSGVKVILRRR